MIAALRRGLAVAGFVLAAGAVALDNRWAGWAAIALLSLSFLLRLGACRAGTHDPT